VRSVFVESIFVLLLSFKSRTSSPAKYLKQREKIMTEKLDVLEAWRKSKQPIQITDDQAQEMFKLIYGAVWCSKRHRFHSVCNVILNMEKWLLDQNINDMVGKDK
jgi:hypothetical protein